MFLSLAMFREDTAVVAVVDVAVVAVGAAVVAVGAAVVAATGTVAAAVVVVVAAVAAVTVVFVSDKSCGALHLKQESQTYNLTQPEKVIMLCTFWTFWNNRDNFLTGEGKLSLFN